MREDKIFKGEVNRYVWHLSRNKYRKSIEKTGLVPFSSAESDWGPPINYEAAVFVNNHDYYTEWFHLDESLWIPPNLEMYDVWLIDTINFETKWYLDYKNQCSGDYLYTKDHIPRERLTLFTINEVVCQSCEKIIEGLPLERVLCPSEKHRDTETKYAHDECLCDMYKDDFDITDRFLKRGQKRCRTGAFLF
jgi:hypothetical protein